MLTQFLRSTTAVFRLFQSPEPPVFRAVAGSRPIWEDGTNYDIPTFLRRRWAAQSM